MALPHPVRATESASILNGKFDPSGLKVTFIRGTFDIDRLLTEATAKYNHFARPRTARPEPLSCHALLWDRQQADSVSVPNRRTSVCGAPSCSNWDPTAAMQHRVLQWNPDDLGTGRVNHGNALAQQALSPAAKSG